MKQKASTTQKRKRPSTTTPSSSKKKGRTSASDLVAQAIDHCNTEDYLKAKACYQNALAMDKNCLEAISGLGYVLMRLNSFKESLQYLKKASAEKPDDTSVWINLAEVYVSTMEPDRAIECCQRVEQLDKDDSLTPYNILSDAYFLKRDFGKTREYCMKSLKRNDGNDYIALGKMGECYHALKMYDTALKYYEYALEIVPDDYIENYNIALLHIDLKNYEEAIHHLQIAIREQPDYADAVNNLGSVYEAIDDNKQAISTYTAYLRRHPRSVSTLCALAAVYLKLKNYKEGAKHAKKATEIDFKVVEAWNICGECYYHLEDYAKAHKNFEAVKKLKSDFVFKTISEEEAARLLGNDHPLIQAFRGKITMESVLAASGNVSAATVAVPSSSSSSSSLISEFSVEASSQVPAVPPPDDISTFN